MNFLKDRLSSSLQANSARIAIEDIAGNWCITYSNLYDQSVAISHWAEQYVGATIVYYGNKSKEYYYFALSCFVQVLNFCPVDTQTPVKRLLEIIAQFENFIIVTDSQKLFTSVKSQNQPVVQFSGCKIVSEASIPLLPRLTDKIRIPEYFVATSGSTGIPKIVGVPHDHTTDFINWSVPFYGVNADTRWAQFSNIGFDLSIVDLLTVLWGGGTLVSVSSRLDRFRPAKTIEKANISHWHSVPSVIPYLLSDCNGESGTCKLFTFCGEPLSTIDIERLVSFYPKARIINTYGPTEATLFCSYYEYVPGIKTDKSTLPIGRPIPGWNFLLLKEDDGLRLIIASQNSANRYVGANTKHFFHIEVLDKKIPAFDTGDYFTQENRELFFSHRVDGMIKISGNRVDLGDIESSCKRLGLQNPVALFVNGKIVVWAEGKSKNEDEIRRKLFEILPSHSVPFSINFNELHPRTSNGKIDRHKLLNIRN